MSAILNAIHDALDVFFIPFEAIAPFWGMLAVSLVTGVLMLVVYKYTSNQDALARVKDRIKAHLLEAWIYREDVAVMLRAQVSVLRANFKYVALNMKPLAVMIIPVVIILVHLNFRYGMRPIRPGEETVVKSVRKEAVTADKMDEKLVAPEGIRVETAGVRIGERGEVAWRVKAVKEGTYALKIKAGDKVYEKTLVVGEPGVRLASRRFASGLVDAFFYPGESVLPDEGSLGKIEINYPLDSPAIPGTGWKPHWLLQYVVLSIIFGLAFKKPFRVEL